MTTRRFKIGVSGSMLGFEKEILERAYEIGKTIARLGHILLTGGSTGYPREAVKGALDNGGIAIGISPALTVEEDRKIFNTPHHKEEIVLYTGLGKHARDIIFIRSCDAVIFINGAEGSLLEFCSTYGSNKPIGILKNSGGVSDHLLEIKEWFYKKPGINPLIVTSPDPTELVGRLIKTLNT